jgi:hypothetical protein
LTNYLLIITITVEKSGGNMIGLMSPVPVWMVFAAGGAGMLFGVAFTHILLARAGVIKMIPYF